MLVFKDYYEKLNPELKEYFKILSPVFPRFLIPYIETDTFERLNGVSYFCGMQYANSDVYEFKYNITRLDHSISTALIVWRNTCDEKMTLAALFHDATTPAFSHCIDYLNKDYIKQESTELELWPYLNQDEKLRHLFEINGIKEEDLKYKNYSLVDNERPQLCADRLDSIFLTNLAWSKKTSLEEVKQLYDNLIVIKNENGKEEFSFVNTSLADRLVELNAIINELTHSKSDYQSMHLAACVIDRLIELGVITKEDLFHMTDEELVMLMRKNITDYAVREYYLCFVAVCKDETRTDVPLKERRIDPLVFNTRYSNK